MSEVLLNLCYIGRILKAKYRLVRKLFEGLLCLKFEI